MHHVWLGNKQIPDNLTKCMKTCYEHHSEWENMMWTDKNMPAPFFFTEEYNIDNNYARKSDLIRLQVLYNYGGVYLDTDVECVKPIDKLFEDYDFVVATECGGNQIKDCNQTHINNAVIGATKRSEVVRKMIEQVKENYRKIEIKPDDRPIQYVARLAGPPVYNQMANIFNENAKTKTYSAEYFYPIHYSHRIKGIKNWQIPADKTKLDENTHLIHHFAASWYHQK